MRAKANDTGLSLQDLKKTLKAELHPVVQELRDLKNECRMMGTQIKQFEDRLAQFGDTVAQLKSDISMTSSKMTTLETQVTRVVATVKSLQEDYGDVTEDFQELETVVEKLDNAQHKNDGKLRGLKEGTEGKDLVGFLTKLFTGWADRFRNCDYYRSCLSNRNCSLFIKVLEGYHSEVHPLGGEN